MGISRTVCISQRDHRLETDLLLSAFIDYLLTPPALLAEPQGNRGVRGAPEASAFQVASAEFPDQTISGKSVWFPGAGCESK